MPRPSQRPRSRLLRRLGGLLARARFYHNAQSPAQERHLVTGAHAVIDVANWEPGIPLDREDINLGAAVQRAVASARGIASERGVRCAVDPATLDADLRVRANAPLLDHILDEFLRNALKAARPGDTVTIRSLPVGDQVWLRLEHGDPSRRSAATVAFQRGRGRENDSADHLPVAGTGSSD